ncbi:hypothetical protein NPS01_17110 [Nocardioides psychrotolerans]|uniref:Uncharacterized protein n=1 Tax=Nocardioides psychrotolerans TaxID=1005945 RepID=A0A1I3ILF1_9ACTN|nr:hypothetical protein NPS01_17110 [Nocardioides psychrotolerans]SFI48603.1 hypothetical protein SAMN05216561_10963 [Nocardioides psychrotolerans]
MPQLRLLGSGGRDQVGGDEQCQKGADRDGVSRQVDEGRHAETMRDL